MRDDYGRKWKNAEYFMALAFIFGIIGLIMIPPNIYLLIIDIPKDMEIFQLWSLSICVISLIIGICALLFKDFKPFNTSLL